MGYSGGSTHAPTYHELGDHSEAVEIDYDPERISYSELLDHFWREHDPRRPAHSRQYRSAIFYRNDEEREAALSSKTAAERLLGRVHTEIEPFTVLYMAETYHQKHALRDVVDVFAEIRQMYPDDAAFVASTAAARANGILDGCVPAGDPDALVASLGLSERSSAHLLAKVHARAGGLLLP